MILMLTVSFNTPFSVHADEVKEVNAYEVKENAKIDVNQEIEVNKEYIYNCDSYEITFRILNRWEKNFIGEFTVKNTSSLQLHNWAFQFDFPYEILNIWNAKIDKQNESTYIIKNSDYNQDIAPGGSVSFGLQACYDRSISLPDRFELMCFEEAVVPSDYDISCEVRNVWENDIIGEICISNQSETTIEDWVVEFDFDGQINHLWNAEIKEHEGNHYVLNNGGYNANIKPEEKIILGYNAVRKNDTDKPSNFKLSQIVNEKVNLSKDTDGDMLPDYIEKQIGTNPKMRDTDNDNLEDGIEVLYGLDPCKVDSDNNGITDDQEDYDKDGLVCVEEILIGTDIYYHDTDYDGLNDYEEVNIYFTNPLVPDTDEDGIEDGSEIRLGLNPRNSDTDGDGILDNDEKIEQTIEKRLSTGESGQIIKASVVMNATGDIEQTTKIENTYGKDRLSSEVVGLIGVPINIESSTRFESAEIIFTYDENLLGNTKEEDLRVMWYDESNNKYVIMDDETVLDTSKNTVSYTTSHFSTYLVVDRQQWYNAWSKEISYRRNTSISSIPTEYFDICYVIDRSGSMYGSSINNAKLEIERFINAMYSNDRGAIIGFDSKATRYSNFTTDKETLRKALSRISATGGTSVEAGLKEALELFESTPEKITNNLSNSKMIILLCDGDVDCTDTTIQLAKKRGIKIYPVLIGSTYGANSLKRIANVTGGTFYYAATADEIRKSLYQVQEGTIDKTDSDLDGLYDIYETAGMKIPNGQIVYSDPTKKDTDGDGLSDAEEMGYVSGNTNVTTVQVQEGKLNYIVFSKYQSHPEKADTDGDKVKDNLDAYPTDSTRSLDDDYFSSTFFYYMDIAKANSEKRLYIYEPKQWETEISKNTKETISKIDNNLTEYERKVIIDGIIIFEAGKLQDKYRACYCASDNVISKYVTERGLHQNLVPLYTQYPDLNNPTIKNKYFRAFMGGFLTGLDYGIEYAAMDWIYTYNYIPKLRGQWKTVNESMSKFSRDYQTQITGRTGEVFLQNGVKFDGMKNGILLDAKGKYAQFVSKATGEFYDWFKGKDALVNEARRQIAASEGARIQWYFAEQKALEATKILFEENNIKGIELIFQAFSK